ncbi:MAG TPA: c-type cytochrome [Candidatus Polarisedimenticolia bacterium]|nr:c-type cytochrome [Candidatus Polarisedimenticolia bacterium]
MRRRLVPARAPRAALSVVAVSAVAVILAFAGAAPARAQEGAKGPGSDAQRQAGQKLYEKYCSQCHGEKGDGQGPAAKHLRPMPRDFTAGKYKIRTTPNGALPLHEDIVSIIRKGMPYTSMPAWPDFKDEEVNDLAYYVASFSPDFANPERTPKQVELKSGKNPSKETIDAGRKAYEANGCLGCHGSQGRGNGTSAPTLKDDWGHPIKPADLTQRWTFRGGGTRQDVFRTLSTGLNGTPMPSYFDAIPDDQRWALVDYIDSLSEAQPDYQTLVSAVAIDEAIDLQRADEQFKKAKTARFPLVGQIMEPGRDFHPPAVSLQVEAIRDSESLAIRVRWHDLRADTTGHNAPDLAVPLEEEVEAGAAPAAGGEGGGDVWGGEEAAPAAPQGQAAAPAGGDVWGEASAEAAPAAGPASEFSDAVAIQWPAAALTSARKPYFIFGDQTSAVDLWFMDLAKPEPRQYTGKGSASLTPNDTGELSGTAHYDDGAWSATFKWPLHPSAGIPFNEGQFVPVAFTVWDGFNRERGNKRALTVWYYLYVAPAVVVSPVVPMLKTAGFVLLLELLAIALVRRSVARPGGEAAPARGRLSGSHGVS